MGTRGRARVCRHMDTFFVAATNGSGANLEHVREDAHQRGPPPPDAAQLGPTSIGHPTLLAVSIRSAEQDGHNSARPITDHQS
jgi:hypothetical protein